MAKTLIGGKEFKGDDLVAPRSGAADLIKILIFDLIIFTYTSTFSLIYQLA